MRFVFDTATAAAAANTHYTTTPTKTTAPVTIPSTTSDTEKSTTTTTSHITTTALFGPPPPPLPLTNLLPPQTTIRLKTRQHQAHLHKESLGENPNVRQGVSGNFHQPQRTPDHGTALPYEESRCLLAVSQGDEESEVALVFTEAPHLQRYDGTIIEQIPESNEKLKQE